MKTMILILSVLVLVGCGREEIPNSHYPGVKYENPVVCPQPGGGSVVMPPGSVCP